MDYATLEALVTDPQFQMLKYKQERSNVFSIVGQTHTEHWHSSFISWLLDPNSSMGLGHFPLARLLGFAITRKPDCGIGAQDVFSKKLDDVRFETEHTFYLDPARRTGKRSIDVYGVSDDLVIVIENKVKAIENRNDGEQGQTVDYYEHVMAEKTPRQKALFFFITPNPKQKCDSPHYVKLLYQELYDVIIAKCLQHPQLPEQSRYLLEQYSSNLRELVNNSPMALVNADLCEALNRKYPDALLEIFNAAAKSYDTAETALPRFLYNHYQSIFDEIYLTLSNDYGTTPRQRSRRNYLTMDELSRAGLIDASTRYALDFDGNAFHAKTAYLSSGECRMQLLHSDGTPFLSPEGQQIGFYKDPDRAALDIVNLHRREQGKEPLETLRGSVVWKTDRGKTLAELGETLTAN